LAKQWRRENHGRKAKDRINDNFDYRSSPLTKHTFTTLMRRLSHAGFKNDFVRKAILPDWWDDTCADQSNLLPEIELRVARFLRASLESIKSPAIALTSPQYSNALLRHVRDIDRDRLAPAIHAALKIGEAVVRSLRDPALPSQEIPTDASAWREQLRPAEGPIRLHHVLHDLWARGVPVVPVEILPSPSFQAIVSIVENRPVILLGYHHDEPGRVAFHLAHEAGHIAACDCAPGQPVVDEADEVADDADIELRANRYAMRLLVGADHPPAIEESLDFKQLAKHSIEQERLTGTEASLIIFVWANRTRDYVKANMAAKALYRGSGARLLLRKHFDHHVDLDAASDSDRALLRCVYGDPDQSETPR